MSHEGLDIIPVDILSQGSVKTTSYLLDLFRSPEAEPLYRTKLMVVGFERIGKTTILDCLFPMRGWLQSQGTMKKTQYYYKLQGGKLAKYDHKDDEVPHKGRAALLENKRWDVSRLKNFGIKVTPKRKEDREWEFYCRDHGEQERWYSRLLKACMNEATHGIEIQSVIVDHPLTDEYFAKRPGRLELSVWDFAGQHDYYNNHHHFLTGRSVFMVLWKMSEGEAGLKGLEFWLRSLSARLARPSHTPGGNTMADDDLEGEKEDTPTFSIVVVGTFLDHESVKREESETRLTRVRAIAASVGITDPLNYVEVSCVTMENMTTLEGAIYSLCLGHPNMGERVPMSYISVEQSLQEYLSQNRELPIITLSELVTPSRGEVVVKRALNLLSLWGRCVYSEDPPELSSLVVLDPKFLTKEILGQVFSPQTINTIKDGVVRHSDLQIIWPSFKARGNFWELASKFMILLEKFEVSFSMNDPGPFHDGRSIIPALLPESEPHELASYWPALPPSGTVHVEKVIACNIVPKELVGRLFVRLHHRIEAKLMWRTGLYFDQDATTKAHVTVDLAVNTIHLRIRDRAEARARCVDLMNIVTDHVLSCFALYPGVTFRQCGISPFSGDDFIDLSECVLQYDLPREERTLRCPATRQLVDPERVLVDAGLMEGAGRQVAQWQAELAAGGAPLWTFVPSESWAPQPGEREGEPEGLATLEVFSDGQVRSREIYQLLCVILGEKMTRGCRRAVAVSNPRQLEAFNLRRGRIAHLTKLREKLFQTEDYLSLKNAAIRADYIRLLHNYGASFPWNAAPADGQVPPESPGVRGQASSPRSSLTTPAGLPMVIPMLHASSEEGAWAICKTGFATVGWRDQGPYGKGIYFTRDMDFATKEAADSPEGGKVLVIGMTVPGNSFPVTEPPNTEVRPSEANGVEPNPKGYRGKDCRPGYQSHYTLVPKDTTELADPIKEKFDPQSHADRLVIFQEAQVLPIFVIYL